MLWHVAIYFYKYADSIVIVSRESFVLFEMFIFSFIIEKITTWCFVFSLYDKNRFIFTIYFHYLIFTILFVLFCILGTCVFYNSWKIFFFLPIHDQIINFHATFWGRFLWCGRVNINKWLTMIGLKLDDKNSKETLVFFIYWQNYSACWFFWIFIL